MRTFDLSPLFRSSVGFERMMSLLDATMRADEAGPSYPPYNIEKTGEDTYRITLAVAGFSAKELAIDLREDVLYVSGGKDEPQDEGSFLYKGIAARSFQRKFQLADHVKVEGANLENGLLHIDLARELPEAMKPRRIEIATGPAAKRKTIVDIKASAA